MCGIVGAVAQRDIAEILLEVYVVWNTVCYDSAVWLSSMQKVI